MEMIEKAREIARNAHLGQKRKGTGVPYITHPMEVGDILQSVGCSPEVIAAGLLHDTIEDTNLTLADIEREFNLDVARIVKGCSEPHKCLPWMVRKEYTLKLLKTASSSIRIVSLADKLQNIRSIKTDLLESGLDLWQRFNAGKDLQAWYYFSLLDSLKPMDSDFAGYAETYLEFHLVVKEVFDLSYNPSYQDNCNLRYIENFGCRVQAIKINPLTSGEDFFKDFLRQYLIHLAKEKKDALLWRLGEEPGLNSEQLKSEVLYEPIYPVSSLAELYKPAPELGRKARESQGDFKNIFRDIPKLFSNKRCETLDIIAGYRPYHYNGPTYGIYIDLLKFTMFIRWVMEKGGLGIDEAKIFALDMVLTHQRFHYLVELYATMAELSSGNFELYANYKQLYSQVWSTEECIEETIANDFLLLSHPNWEVKKLELLAYYFERQLNGYHEANGVTSDNRQDFYLRLELEMFPKKTLPKINQILEINKLPMAQLSLRNIPVYLVDDTRSQNEFRLVRLFLGLS
ncbi:MAG: HD domain-containing protein [Desulfitobacterium hafniense]|nr:HD domain-containing protein [Desulfitobacterium hafniense]